MFLSAVFNFSILFVDLAAAPGVSASVFPFPASSLAVSASIFFLCAFSSAICVR